MSTTLTAMDQMMTVDGGDLTLDQIFFLQMIPLLKPDFQRKLQELDRLFQDKTVMPSKIHLTEEENLVFDQTRITYIIDACQFLRDYFATGKTPLQKAITDTKMQYLLDCYILLNTRRLLEQVAVTIFNISGSVRVKYKDLLAPAPFTWQTFEHLGGLMKMNVEWGHFIIRGIQDTVAKRLSDEQLNTERLIEAAIPSILNDDICKLHFLFSYIQKAETGQLKTGFTLKKPVELTAIKALSRRIVDSETIVQLLKYADNHVTNLNHREIMAKIKFSSNSKRRFCVKIDKSDQRFSREIDLTSRLSQHAALRRLEKIGELVTGKYLSSFIKELDPSIDWTALNCIRDTIAHQDEAGNHLKVQKLLADPTLLKKVLVDDMQELFKKLIAVVNLRDAILPKYVDDADVFWQSVYAYEKQRFLQLTTAQNIITQPTMIPRASVDDITYFCDQLKGKSVSDPIIKEWTGILDGSQPLPGKKELGNLMKHIPSRKEDKENNKKCKQIIDQAKNPRSTLTERNATREQARTEAAKKRAAEQAKLSGLTHIRQLASNWQQKSKGNRLKPQQRIQLAINALENIKLFMEQDQFIQANFNFSCLADWEKNQNKETAMNFFARLITSPEFSDALEYNAAQLLQHLETIRELPEAKGYRFIDKQKDYEVIRHLRNWLEHGNHLHDKVESEPDKEPSLLQARQKVVGPIMVRLIFDLLPALYSLQEKYTWQQDICVASEQHSFWRQINIATAPPNDQHDINQPCGPGYGF